MKQVNITIVGSSGVGKTTLAKCIQSGSFLSDDEMQQLRVQEREPFDGAPKPSYTLLNAFQKETMVDGENYGFSFTDTADTGSQARTRPLKYMDMSLCLICFAFDDEQSFKDITERAPVVHNDGQVKRQIEQFSFLQEVLTATQHSNCAIFVVGLKNDVLKPAVSVDEMQALLKKHPEIIEVHSVSCLNKKGISELLLAVSRAAVKNYKDQNRKQLVKAKDGANANSNAARSNNNARNNGGGGGGGGGRGRCALF